MSPSTVCARVGGTSSAPLLRGDVPDATPVPMWQGMGNLGQEQPGRRVPSAGFETSASPGHHEAEPGTPGGLLGGGSPHPWRSAPFYFPPSTIFGGPPGAAGSVLGQARGPGAALMPFFSAELPQVFIFLPTPCFYGELFSLWMESSRLLPL